MNLRFVFELLLVSGLSNQTLIALQPVQTIKNSIIPPLLLLNQTKKSDQQVATSLKNNAMIDLDDYKWKKRLLLVLAPKEDPVYQKQIQLFNEQKVGLNERDLLIIQLLVEGTSRIDTQPISPVLAAQIRERFKVEHEDFQVILVGKDGTTKWRDHSLVPPEVIFGEIDAMPMRQQEMRSRSN